MVQKVPNHKYHAQFLLLNFQGTSCSLPPAGSSPSIFSFWVHGLDEAYLRRASGPTHVREHPTFVWQEWEKGGRQSHTETRSTKEHTDPWSVEIHAPSP